jgi:hypothetical protein
VLYRADRNDGTNGTAKVNDGEPIDKDRPNSPLNLQVLNIRDYEPQGIATGFNDRLDLSPHRTLAAPDDAPVTSRVAEIHELGGTMAVAQRSIWSFARFVPKDIVKGIIDNSISTELHGVRQDVTILFTDVTNFTASRIG